MIILDGSVGEGGGQIIRTALALSTLTGKPFRITNIRAGREKPGLAPQHLAAVKAAQQLCNAQVDGAFERSLELLYIPGPIQAKNISIDIGTAGSVTLLLQAIMLPCMFAQKTHTITLIGGTDVLHSMPIDYLAQIVLPHFRRFAGIELKLQKRGYYPRGSGHIEIKFKPAISRNAFETIDTFRLALTHLRFSMNDQGKLVSIKGTSHASKHLLASKVAERQANAATTALTHLNVPIEITCEYSDTPSIGSGITLWAIFSTNDDVDSNQPIRLGASALGAKAVSAETVGENAARELLVHINSRAPVDLHLADNLVPLAALCPDSSFTTEELTPHTLTNIQVVEAFLGKILEIKNKEITSKK